MAQLFLAELGLLGGANKSSQSWFARMLGRTPTSPGIQQARET